MINMTLEKSLFSREGELRLSMAMELKEGDFVTLFGRSGAGKTTLLRMIAGLTRPDEGLLTVGGEVWFDSAKGIHLPPQKREVGFVFQDYALFPTMTVKENLEYALGSKKRNGVVDELLEIIELRELQNRMPDTLSGGQKQRVALARALVRRPKILLLDEPLSALDREMRVKLQDELITIHKRFGVTIILVSHDLSEVFKLSNKVFVIDQGKVTMRGTPLSVFGREAGNGGFTFPGEIVAIDENEVCSVLTVLTGNNLVKVLGTEEEAQTLRIGDKVILSTKTFSPAISRADSSGTP